MTVQDMPDDTRLSGLATTFTDWPWRHWRQVRAETPALRLNDEVLNWRELCARVDALATGFAAQGVKEGDGVLLRAGIPLRQRLPGWRCCRAGRECYR